MKPWQWQLSQVEDCASSGDLSPSWEAAGEKDFGTGTSLTVIQKGF